jgi:hypothetical protein
LAVGELSNAGLTYQKENAAFTISEGIVVPRNASARVPMKRLDALVEASSDIPGIFLITGELFDRRDQPGFDNQ